MAHLKFEVEAGLGCREDLGRTARPCRGPLGDVEVAAAGEFFQVVAGNVGVDTRMRCYF